MVHTAAWRSMWLRTSMKPQDMVFSVMHFLGVSIEVNYNKSLYDLIFELVEKIAFPAWLLIGYDIPVYPNSGLIPILPEFTPNSVPMYEVNGKSCLASDIVFADFYCGKFDVVIKSTSRTRGHAICAQFFDSRRSSYLRKDDKDSSFQISDLSLGCPGYEFDADCTFRGKIGEIVMIIGPSQTGREVRNYEWSGIPFIHLLGKSENDVWIKTGAGTLDEPIFKRKSYLQNVVRRHLRVGGGSGAEMEGCDCEISPEEKKLKAEIERDPDVFGPDLNKALIKASSKGEINLIRQLLEMGADINTYTDGKGCPLHAACKDGKLRVVRLLIEKGANVNAGASRIGSPLQTASYWGQESVARLLLQNGAAVDTPPGPNGTALQCEVGSLGLINLLLEYGADPNAVGGAFGTVLIAASLSWSDDGRKAIELLLDKGADINSTDGVWSGSLNSEETYCTAVQIASSTGELSFIRFLLARGADPNVSGGTLGNALQVAAAGAMTLVMRTLIESGANVHAQGGKYGSALQVAARENRGQSIESIRLLLDLGVDINTQGGEYGNALQAATSVNMPNEELVEFLLENGANVNALGGRWGTPLQGAAAGDNPRKKIINLLLRAGADVNAQGGHYGNVLKAAAACCGYIGNFENHVAFTLLEYGADVNAQGGYYGNALQAAANAWTLNDDCEEKLVRLLIGRGANVNAVGGHFASALQAAASNGKNNKRIVTALLEHGADVNIRGGKFGSAIQAALDADHLEISGLLIKAGADLEVEEKYAEGLQKALELNETKGEKKRAKAKRPH